METFFFGRFVKLLKTSDPISLGFFFFPCLVPDKDCAGSEPRAEGGGERDREAVIS